MADPIAPADLVWRYLRPGTLQLGESPPLSLYVHLPWCLAKCPYCDFNSHELPAAPPAAGPLAQPMAWPGAATARHLPETRYLERRLAEVS